MNSMEDYKLSVILPCFNEEGNLEEIHRRLVEQIPMNYEIIFVDDGSSDKTLEVAKRIAEKDPNTFFISLSKNFGHQAALKAGLDHVTGDCAISMDADLQHPPSMINEMIKKWQEGYDIVQTIRKDKNDIGFIKRGTSKLFYNVLNKISEIEILPGSADFRLIDRKVINSLKSFEEYYLFYRGLIPHIGFKKYNLDYEPAERFSGATKYSFKKMLRLAADGITSFSTRPLKLAVFIGLFLMFLSFLYASYIIFIYFFTDKAISGWASIMLTIIFLGSVQIMILGIIGEYLGKLFIENKRRPTYLVQEKNI